MKLGSLFDGIGGFPLGFSRHGFMPMWASEIEPFPIRVTSLRFPGMKHMGDITQINGAEIEPVDVIAGGSPCQDLSVAGKRAGLSGARSGLFMEQVRIVREMRQNHGKPRFMVWENVPGALSSNGGEDFRIVLEEICRVADGSAVIPGPPAGGWKSAGAIVGNGYCMAWRIMDAQYWGVPQRRRRIYLVADFDGKTATEVLFKREGLHRHLEACRKARQGAAGDTAGGVGKAVAIDNNCQDSRFKLVGDVCPTIPAKAGTGGNNGPMLMVAGFRPNQSAAARSLAYSENVSPTLPSEEGGNKACVVYPIHDQATRFAGKRGDRQDGKGNGLGIGHAGDPCPTLTKGDHHAVCYGIDEDKNATIGKFGTLTSHSSGGFTGAVAHTLRARHCLANRDDSDTLIMAHGQANAEIMEGICPTLNCDHEQPIAAIGLAVRRLMPMECCRLQGYPDGWCDIPGASDSAQYKAYGNSVAIPCVEYVAEGISEVLTREAEGK